MIRRPATSQTEPATRAALLGLCSLALPIALLVSPPPVAGASGSVSVTIRVEVDPVDLHGGGLLDGARAGADEVAALLAPVLRRSLAARYAPSEIDRIVDSVADDCVVVRDGEVVARTSTDPASLSRDGESVFIL